MAKTHPLIARARQLPHNWRKGRTGTAAFLGCHVNSVTRYVRKGLLEYDATEGGRSLISRDELLRFLREWYCNPCRPGPGRPREVARG